MIYEIEAAALDPNPHRDFKINPLQNAQIDALKHSFEQNGDIGIIPVREHPEGGGFQIVAGHHRVEAMRALGYRTIECKVVEYDEAQMLIGMIAENATQYGGNPASQLDSIAGAVKMIAYWMMISDTLGDTAHFCAASLFASQKSFEIAKGMLTSKAQIGERTIYALIGNDTLTQPTIRAKLAELNATGHMSKLVKGAFKRVKAEMAEQDAAVKAAAKEAEQAEKEAKKAEAAAKLAQVERDKRMAAIKAEQKAEAGKLAKKRLAAEQARLKTEAIEAAKRDKLRKVEAKKQAEARAEQAEVDKRNAAMREAQAAADAKTAYLHPDVIGMFENTAQVEMFRNNVKGNLALFPERDQVALVKRMIKGLKGSAEGLSKRSIDAFMGGIVTAHDSHAKQAADDLRKREEKRSKERKADGVVLRFEQALDKLAMAMSELEEAARDEVVANWILNKSGKLRMIDTLDRIERGIPEVRKRLKVVSKKAQRDDIIDPSVIKVV